MTIQQSVMDSIIYLEEAIQTRWIKRALIICPDEQQCDFACTILTNLDYMVEKITMRDIDMNKEDYQISIYRLESGLSKVLVTTGDALKKIQMIEKDPMKFDVVL